MIWWQQCETLVPFNVQLLHQRPRVERKDVEYQSLHLFVPFVNDKDVVRYFFFSWADTEYSVIITVHQRNIRTLNDRSRKVRLVSPRRGCIRIRKRRSMDYILVFGVSIMYFVLNWLESNWLLGENSYSMNLTSEAGVRYIVHSYVLGFLGQESDGNLIFVFEFLILRARRSESRRRP